MSHLLNKNEQVVYVYDNVDFQSDCYFIDYVVEVTKGNSKRLNVRTVTTSEPCDADLIYEELVLLKEGCGQ